MKAKDLIKELEKNPEKEVCKWNTTFGKFVSVKVVRKTHTEIKHVDDDGEKSKQKIIIIS